MLTMKARHHILAAIDFTPSCRCALQEAVLRAAQDGATVTAVHVMDEFLLHELKKNLSVDDGVLVHEWRQRLEKFVAETEGAAGLVECEIRLGHPYTGLVQACQHHQADLLVMGAKGSRNEPGRIGVIAAKCIRKAPVDVLVVREDARGPFRKIVACVDFSENSAKAVQHALRIATQDGASVDCLYVFQSVIAMSLDYGGLMPSMTGAVDPEAQAHWEKRLDEFLDPVVGGQSAVPVNRVVTERVNIREAILDYISKTEASLVVLGTRGKTGLREFLIGTTAENIVQHAPCSILAVKP